MALLMLVCLRFNNNKFGMNLLDLNVLQLYRKQFLNSKKTWKSEKARNEKPQFVKVGIVSAKSFNYFFQNFRSNWSFISCPFCT